MTTGHYNYSVRRKIHKEDIVEAGYNLMYLNGYSNTGIKEITNAVDIPKGSFYNHFSSKEEFGIAVIDHYRATFMQGVRQLLVDKSISAYQRLVDLLDLSIEKAEVEYSCKMGCLVGNFSQELGDINDRFASTLTDAFGDMKSYYVACIQEAKDDNTIKSNYTSIELADFLINTWQGGLIRMKTDRNTNQLKLIRKIMFESILI